MYLQELPAELKAEALAFAERINPTPDKKLITIIELAMLLGANYAYNTTLKKKNEERNMRPL